MHDFVGVSSRFVTCLVLGIKTSVGDAAGCNHQHGAPTPKALGWAVLGSREGRVGRRAPEGQGYLNACHGSGFLPVQVVEEAGEGKAGAQAQQLPRRDGWRVHGARLWWHTCKVSVVAGDHDPCPQGRDVPLSLSSGHCHPSSKPVCGPGQEQFSSSTNRCPAAPARPDPTQHPLPSGGRETPVWTRSQDRAKAQHP